MRQEQLLQQLESLLHNARIQDALAFIEQDAPRILGQQVELAEIPAPPFTEQKRSLHYQQLLKNEGLVEVVSDELHNTYGFYEAVKDRVTLLMSAHLDSVFDHTVDVNVQVKHGIYYGPGIADDARGLAVILGIIRALKHVNMSFASNLLLGANVGEEGIGDLRGIKHLIQSGPHIDGFLTIDGISCESLESHAVGSVRYNITFTAQGGHSYSDFGRISAVHVASEFVTKMASIEPLKMPKTTYNIGMIEGGTFVTAIAQTCRVSIDLRSTDSLELQKLDDLCKRYISEIIEEANDRAQDTDKVTVVIEEIGRRPAGEQDIADSILQVAVCVNKVLGIDTVFGTGMSSDANFPISLGIPSLQLGGGGSGGNFHALSEWYDPINGHIGVQRIFLVLVALLGIEGQSAPLLAKRWEDKQSEE